MPQYNVKHLVLRTYWFTLQCILALRDLRGFELSRDLTYDFDDKGRTHAGAHVHLSTKTIDVSNYLVVKS